MEREILLKTSCNNSLLDSSGEKGWGPTTWRKIVAF